MSGLESIDVAAFRWVNQSWSHPALDTVLPWFSQNPVFGPVLLVVFSVLLARGGIRGRLFVLLLLIIIGLGDMLVINSLKKIIARPRPFYEVADAIVLLGRSGSGAMPSSHTSTWFAAAFITFVFYRRSWRFMLPLACVVGLSRVYVGVHYPSDVLAGAMLGTGYAAAGLWGFERLWQWAGRRWFPEWWQRCPSLLKPPAASPVEDAKLAGAPPAVPPPEYFLRLGYAVIAVALIAHLGYLAKGAIELSEDEAYQWLWSKRLALSYYSKPPMIAWAQWLGTALWGDTAFGVRFVSPLLSAAVSLVLLRFLAREVNAQAGFLLVLACQAVPLLGVGSTLLTVDPLLIAFWTGAMVCGWRAAQPDGALRHWLWTGLWMGLAFLSKYTALLQLACWALFFALWPPARAQLRKPGPYLALVVLALCSLPVLIWNLEHGWITVTHVSENAKLDKVWRPTLRYLLDFLAGEGVILNPVFAAASAWSMCAFWKRGRRDPVKLFLFSMGAPVFLVYLVWTLRARVQLNWIAAAVLPLFALSVLYWQERWQAGTRWVKPWFSAGLALGLAAVVVLHETELVGKLMSRPLPLAANPLRRVRGISDIARLAGQARQDLLREGRPVIVIAAHYGLASQITFYLPEARAGLPDAPLVFAELGDRPQNQFYFWPGYRERHRGHNAIYVLDARDGPERPPPASLQKDFESVESLGIVEAKFKGRVFHRLQLYACRNLR
jgi:membrane-associated phospholipid phosphatase